MKDGNFEVKSKEEIDKMSVTELAEYQTKHAEHKQAQALKAIEEKIDAIKESADKDSEASKSTIAELNKEIESLKKENDLHILRIKGQAEKSTFKITREDEGTLSAQMKKNKEQFEALKDKRIASVSLDVDDIATKATHNPTDISDREQLGQWIPGVNEIPYQRVYMADTFNRARASTEYVKQVYQNTLVRDAKNVAACAESTHNSKVDFAIADLQMKKIRDFTHVCIDMMDDYSFVESQIRKLIDTDIRLKEDYDLLLGDGLSANINGIDSYASTFSASSTGANYAGKIEEATLIDLLVVAGAQIKAFGAQNFFMPNYIMLNPVDATLMGLLKDEDKNYIKVGSVNASVFRDRNGSLFINGMRVVENPNVPANEAYIYDGRKATYYERKGMTIEFAYENRSNFEQELVTVKGVKRGNLWVAENDANAFMHIDDISAGIVAITPT